MELGAAIVSFDVFISHFTEENVLAEELQYFLGNAFGSADFIFRSSDDGSIRTGADQYEEILKALRSAKVVIALVSVHSWRRPWLNFEAGFAKATGATFFTVLIRGTKHADIGTPLSQMQLRDLANRSVVGEILSAIANATGRSSGSVDIDSFITRFKKVEGTLPNTELALKPILFGGVLQFEIIYKGVRPVELTKIVAKIPWDLKKPNTYTGGAAGHLISETKSIEGKTYWLKERLANAHPPGSDGVYFGYQPLSPLLFPSPEPQLIGEPKFELLGDAKSRHADAVIEFQLFTKDGAGPIQRVALRDVEER